MESGQRLDRGTLRERDHLPVVQPVPLVVRPDRVRRPDRLGADGVVGPVVSGRRGLGVGRACTLRNGCAGQGCAGGVEGERRTEEAVRGDAGENEDGGLR